MLSVGEHFIPVPSVLAVCKADAAGCTAWPPCRQAVEEPLEGDPWPGCSRARALLQVVTAQFALSHSDWMLVCSLLSGTFACALTGVSAFSTDLSTL